MINTSWAAINRTTVKMTELSLFINSKGKDSFDIFRNLDGSPLIKENLKYDTNITLLTKVTTT